jgi:hypothetical protein
MERKSSKAPWKRPGRLLLAVMGLALTVHASLTLISVARLRRGGLTVKATLEARNVRSKTREYTRYSKTGFHTSHIEVRTSDPYWSFDTVSGENIELPTVATLDQVEHGDSREVVYLPQQPRVALLKDVVERPLWQAAEWIGGLALIGWAMLRKMRPPHGRDPAPVPARVGPPHRR